MSDTPKISVVMPVWNGGKYVREAIDSILNQTFSDFEFIIIDDGSTDQTIAIIESYDDPRIRLFKREHEGIVSALNFGVEHARADWIARQDADDLSHPRRFEWQWRAVHRQNGTVLCYGNADYIDENGGRALVRESHFARTQALLRVLMLFKCPIIHTSVLFNKDAFSAAGGYLQEERHAEDYGLWGRMLADGRFVPVSKRLVRFRVHPESISNKCGTEQSSLTHIALYTDVNAGDVLLPRCLRDVFENAKGSLRWEGLHAHRPVSDEIIAKINKTDGVVIGGGGLFLKDSNPNNLSGWQWSCSIDALKKINVPIALFAVGYNRFRGQKEFAPIFAEHVRVLAEKSVYVGLRNHGSIDALKKYLPTDLHHKLRFQPCMTTLCKKLYPDLIDRARREKKGEFIAINCAFDRIEKRLNGRHDEILFNLAVTLRELSLTYPIAYYAHGKSDEQMLPYLDEVGVPYELVKLYDVHPREVIEAYSRAALAIGMRGHAQMIPFGCGTPIVSLISHDKIRWFLDDIRHPEWGIEMSSESFQKDLARRVFQTMETLDQTVATINIIQDELFETTQQNIHDLMSVLRDNTQKV